RSEAEERFGCDDVPAARLTPRDPLQLAQLFERVDPDVRVRADADADVAGAHSLDGKEAVAEVRLRRRAGADPRARARDEVELGVVRMRRVHDGGAFEEATGPVEQLDRPHVVLGEALLDLTRLLVGVDAQGAILRG